jgi:plasmid stability protein
MKNVTIALDDETHRKARIRAAELGTSLSALVKRYLETLAAPDGDVAPVAGVREMPTSYAAPPPQAQSAEYGPWLVDGKWVWTKDGKPRQPGAMRGMTGWTEDFDETPQWLIDAFEGKDTHLPWPGTEAEE